MAVYKGDGVLTSGHREELIGRYKRHIERERIKKSRELVEMRQLVLEFHERRAAAG